MVLVLAACGGGGGSGSSDKLVFVTASDFDGGFGAGQAATIDAAAIADTQCQTAAQGAGHDGTFVAWMSRTASSAQPQRNAIDVIQSEGPWRTTNGDMAFLNHSALANSPQTGVQWDEYGQDQYGIVWTGTKTGGTLSTGTDCQSWHSGDFSVMGVVGQASGGSQWTDAGDFPCDQRAHLYCFEL